MPSTTLSRTPESRGLRIEANMFTNAQGLHLLEPRSRWTCLPAVHVSEKWSQHNFKQDAGWFKTSDQGEYVYQSHQYTTYTQTLDMFANSARVWKTIPAQHSSFQVSMISTLTLSSCARKAATNTCVRVLCALQGSTFRLMFSHLELTQNHVFQVRMLWFFNRRHKYCKLECFESFGWQ